MTTERGPDEAVVKAGTADADGWPTTVPPKRAFRVAEGLVLVAFAVLLVRNALVYPAIAGIDASEHIRHAWELVVNGRLDASGSYYTPPGWYAIAGELLRLGDWLDLDSYEQPAQLLSAGLTVATAVVLLALVGRVFPGRPWLRLWTLAGFCACPAVVKPAAMVHPQPLVLFLSVLALYLLVVMVGAGRWSLVAGAGLGLVLGAGQLVRSVGLWTFVAVALTFAAAFALRLGDRRRIAAVAGTALALGVLVPLPWYAYLQIEYGDPIFGGRPEIRQGAGELTFAADVGAPPVPPPLRAPLSFFTTTGLPETVTEPYRGGLRPAFVPVVLVDSWGDYFGQWRWGIPDAALDPPDRRRLQAQALVGLPLAFTAVSGLVALGALLVLSPRRRLSYLPIVAVPLLAVASLAVYAWRYPSFDGDTVKALFLLPAAPSLAAAFGFAVDVGRRSLPRSVRVAGAGVLAVALLVSLEFCLA